MNNRLSKIINEISEQINNHDWDYVYKYVNTHDPVYVGELTEALLSIGVDPAAEMGIIPEGYLVFSHITHYNIPENVSKIGDGAFQHCENLHEMVIPEGVISIGRYAFSRCLNLEIIHLPNSLKAIGGTAFSGCKKLTTIYYNGNYEEWVAIYGRHYVARWDTNTPIKLICNDKTLEHTWEI